MDSKDGKERKVQNIKASSGVALINCKLKNCRDKRIIDR